jgi:hypothetical protein
LWRQCWWYVVAATSTTANFNAGDSSHPSAGKFANADPHFKHDHDYRSLIPPRASCLVEFSHGRNSYRDVVKGLEEKSLRSAQLFKTLLYLNPASLANIATLAVDRVDFQ